MFLIVCCLVLIELNAGANVLTCPKSDVNFEKVLGLRPQNGSQPSLLYQLDNTTSRPITLECIAKCQANEACRSFVLFYGASRCYWFSTDFSETDESQLIIDENAAWFLKRCYSSGRTCEKLWIFERIPGTTLIGNDTKTLPGALSRSDCQQYCLNETDFVCRSVKFHITKSSYEENTNIRGTCTLSDADRHQLPNSYRVSVYEDEYFENECTSNNLNEPKNEFCAYEEYDNVTLAHSDVSFQKTSKENCQHLCESFKNFNCRAFTTINRNTCYLHSEDTKIFGPSLLIGTQHSTYYEKASCLNITVSCSETYMTVRYNPEIDFVGKMFMQGFSDNPSCSADGEGKFHITTLRLPLLSGQCGIIKAEEPLQRTLLSGEMIIQFNPIIQTQSDRLIRVGCIFGNDTKVVVGTGVTISPVLPNKGSAIISPTMNNTSNPPVIEMKIVDPHTGQEVSDTQIGQELQLRIELKSRDDNLDIWASHLIAMTEKNDESIFLLDDRGCPTNLNIFPPLQKIVAGTTKVLVANFQAFKFANSPIVRFSVIIQFCVGECPPVDCGNNIMSYGRKRRDTQSQAIYTMNGTTVEKVNRSEFEDRSSVMYEMPLEYIMLVRDTKSTSDRLVVGDNNKILVAGYDYSTNEVCLDYSLVIGLIVLWMLIQVFFIVGCIVLVRRYKRYYQHECTRQSLEELHKNFGIGFSNLENRRVRWADDENIL
ncbi:unnamed protein product [Phaedon cochleariae]|uniref:Uncharacterized protein n=1 Tax=Phaedon cochleariae TaxID=80249 RepID=A0A9P0GIL0_PHACE|nr:unnamed protein product [Phaedon cochleariae]